MRRSVFLGFSLIGLIVLTGCQKSADALVKQRISNMNELADAVESGEDAEEILTLIERTGKTAEALHRMDLSKNDEKRLKHKYRKDMEKAQRRVAKAFQSRGPGDPGQLMKAVIASMIQQ